MLLPDWSLSTKAWELAGCSENVEAADWVIVAGSESVTAPVDALAVIWLAVPEIEVTPAVAVVNTSLLL